MKNWKTSLIGALGAGAYAIAAAIQQGKLTAKDIAIAFTIAALGFLAKDFNVTGGTVSQ